MNLKDRLFEAISNGIYQSLNEGKLTIKEKYDLDKAHNKTKLDFMLYKQACEVDPTYNQEKGLVGIYANWLVQHIENREQIEQLRAPLEWYANGVKKNILQRQGVSGDIGKYKSVEEFLDAMKPLMQNTDIKISGSEYNNREKLKGQFEILGSSKYWEIITPLTWEAERWFGRETQWCTVANNDYFKRYNGHNGELIIFYPKDEKLLKQRIQIHFKLKQYCDVENAPYKTILNAIEKTLLNYNIANDLIQLYNKIFNEQISIQKESFLDNYKIIDEYYIKKKKFKVYNNIIKKVIKYCIANFGNECDLNFLDTTDVTNMAGLFYGIKNFNGHIEKWNTSNVKYMAYMFQGAESFNQPIGDWNTSNCESMHSMFYDASSFNQPIGNWDVHNVKNMYSMFCGATSFNQPIENWGVSNVEYMAEMFCGAKSFNQPIGDWDVSNVEYMNCMFHNATSFNQPIGDWDVSNVKYMQNMFNSAISFNQPLNNWDISNVKDMRCMFDNAKSFNQLLDNWDISNIKYNYKYI